MNLRGDLPGLFYIVPFIFVILHVLSSISYLVFIVRFPLSYLALFVLSDCTYLFFVDHKKPTQLNADISAVLCIEKVVPFSQLQSRFSRQPLAPRENG